MIIYNLKEFKFRIAGRDDRFVKNKELKLNFYHLGKKKFQNHITEKTSILDFKEPCQYILKHRELKTKW